MMITMLIMIVMKTRNQEMMMFKGMITPAVMILMIVRDWAISVSADRNCLFLQSFETNKMNTVETTI